LIQSLTKISVMKKLLKKVKKAALYLIPEFVKCKIFEDKCPEYPNRCVSMKWSIENLKRLGLRADYILDIGAYCGLWTDMIKAIYPEAQILMVEPQLNKENDLLKVAMKYSGSVKYSMSFLGSQSGKEVDFFEMESGSSAFQERSAIPRKKVQKNTITLCELLRNFNWDKVDFIKIDAQGYELEILKGATDILRSVKCILMEVSLIDINEGAPLFLEVISFMNDRGFVPYDICSLLRRPLDQALWQVDMIFLPNRSSLLKHKYFDSYE